MTIRTALAANEDDAREALMDLRRERREDYASLSRLIGRRDSYLADWVHKASPKVLPTPDKEALARYFNLSPQLLGVPLEDVEPRPAYVKPPLRARA